ncbi:class I SAM-dependent methyltransferase [Ideonella sp. DXS29W]|uniref:Class I SAM-dependent methyltransferase n=1 Tax=Ideonella lacteola TaxID=2984193 RepID=A0ABU9BPR8_9BURK
MSHAQDYYANYGGLEVADYVERHIRGSASEMDRMRRTVELVPPQVATLLDVGAGHGVFLEELRTARGIAGVGIEITPAKVDYARSRGVDLRLGDAGALAFGDRSFDAVVSCEVLEHLPFGVYEAALSEFARVAREWIIVTVPYDERRRFVQCPYCSARVNPDYHFRSFGPDSMRGLLPGFRLERTLALGRQRRSALVALGRRFFDRWPRFLVCPSCGFQEPTAVAPSATSAASGQGDAVVLARQAAAWVPARSRPVWLVGVFRRESRHV